METQQNLANPAQPSNPTPEKKNKLYVVLGLVVLILIAVAGVFLLPKSQKQNEQINSTNWKSYSNSHYEIEFKYPSDMSVKESGTTIFVKSDSQNIVTIETGNINNVRNDNPWNANSQAKLETVRFAGASASVYTCPQNNPCPSGIIYSKVINLKSLPNDWRVGNVIFYDLKQGQEQSQALAESILSTFKFNFSNPIATWNIYPDPKQNFAIHYPPDFTAEYFEEQGGQDPKTGVIETNQGVKFKKNGVDFFALDINNTIASGGAPSQQTGSGTVTAYNASITKTKGFNYQSLDKTPISYYVYYSFKYGSDNYRVILAEETPELRDQKEKVVDKILSTIIFSQ